MAPAAGEKAQAMDQRPPSSSSDCSLDIEEFGDLVSISIKPKPKEKFTAKLHAQAVAKRLGVESGLIYLPSLPALTYEDSDQPVYFRQRRYFFYLSGLNLTDSAVTYHIKSDTLTAWIPPQNTGSNVIYNGQNPSREEIKANYDFDHVEYNTKLVSFLSQFAHFEKRGTKIYALHDYQAPETPLQRWMPLPDGTYSILKDTLYDFERLKPAMDASRAVKSPYEIKLIRKANEITAKAHVNVLRSIRSLQNEAEIEAIFAATCIAEQARQQAYGIIAGSGENASTLHYIANNEPLKGRQLVCLDAGCEWNCYASDVTRTFPISGKFTPEAKEIYDIVAEMQESCISLVKPGANYRDIHFAAHKVAIRGLSKLGLLQNGDFAELFLSGVSTAFFPHGLGHYLGLECHDVGEGGDRLTLFQSRLNKYEACQFRELAASSPCQTPEGVILTANMVITIEPGLYFSRYALEEVALKNPRIAKYINKDVLEKYYPVGGVRIEDDILVTDDGYENLTNVPKGENALKIINGEEDAKLPVDKRVVGWLW